MGPSVIRGAYKCMGYTDVWGCTDVSDHTDIRGMYEGVQTYRGHTNIWRCTDVWGIYRCMGMYRWTGSIQMYEGM